MPLDRAGLRFETENMNGFLRDVGQAIKKITDAQDAIVNLGRMTENRIKAMDELNDSLAILGDTAGEMAKGFDSAQKAEQKKLLDMDKALGAAAKGFGKWTGIFWGVGTAIGAAGGTALGAALLATPIPFIDELIGFFGVTLAGGILGAIVGIGVDIGVAIADMLKVVIDQLSNFLPKVLKKIYDFTAPIVNAVFKLVKSVFDAAKNLITGIFDKLTGGLFGRSGKVTGFTRYFGDSLFKAMFRFEIFKQVIRGIINEFKGLVKASYDAGSTLQVLTVRLDNLIGRQIRNIGLTDDYARSIEIASGYTQELLSWVKELAIATPIGIEAISETVSLGLAMGWSVQGTKELTQAILDYSAAQGLSNDVMDKIIYNFAQMRQAGKVTGTELRDLARGAYLPVNTILEETANRLGLAGDSFQEFRDMASTGAIPVEEFFQTFVEWAGREFPDAARKMNITIEAVRDNIKDLFKTLVGWNMIKPMFDAIAVHVQSVLDKLNTPEVERTTKLIGMGLKDVVENTVAALKELMSIFSMFFETLGIGAPSINSIVKSIVKFGFSIRLLAMEIRIFVEKNILPIFGKMRDDVNETMSGLPSDMFTWGFNMIKELGKGIMRGISMWLTKAMEMIAGILTWWLKPGSPPRIAPEIDLWGLDTISEWLRGFTEADFTMLDSMKDSLKGALDALVDLGVLDEQVSAQMYVNISADLIGAIEEFNRTGVMTNVIFEQLSSVAGVFGEELVTLMNMQIELAEATERVADAQEAYNAAVEATKASTRLVNTSIREYNALLRAGEDRTVLDARLAEINAAEEQLALDRAAEIAAQQELDAAEAQLEIIEEMVSLQEQLIQQLIDLAKAQADAARATGGGGGGEEPGAAEEPDLLGGLGELPNVEDLEGLFETLRSVAMAELAGMWRDLKQEWLAEFQANFGEGSAFQTAWGNMIDLLTQVWNEKLVPIFGFPELTELGTIWEGITWEDIFPFLQDDDPGFGYFPGQEWLIPDPTEDTGILANFIDLELIVGRIKDTWDLFIASMFAEPAEGEEGSLPYKIYDWVTNAGAKIEELLLDPESSLHKIIVTGGNLLGGSLIEGFKEGIVTKFSEILFQIFGPFFLFMDEVRKIFGVESPSTVFAEIGGDLIEGLFNGITDTLTSLWSIVENAFWGFVNSILDIFGIGKSGKEGGGSSSVFLEIGKSLIDGFTEGITTAVNSIIGPEGAIATTINGIINKVKEILGIKGDGKSSVFSGIGGSVMEGLKNGMENAFGSIERFLESIISQLPQWAKDWLNIESPSGVFADIGSNIIAGLAEGMLSTSDMAYDAMNNVIQKSLVMPTVTAPVNVPAVADRGSVNFGDVTINDTMDWTVFKARVQQAVME